MTDDPGSHLDHPHSHVFHCLRTIQQDRHGVVALAQPQLWNPSVESSSASKNCPANLLGHIGLQVPPLNKKLSWGMVVLSCRAQTDTDTVGEHVTGVKYGPQKEVLTYTYGSKSW